MSRPGAYFMENAHLLEAGDMSQKLRKSRLIQKII